MPPLIFVRQMESYLVNGSRYVQFSFVTRVSGWVCGTLREESSQTNVILQYKLLASILSAVCSVI